MVSVEIDSGSGFCGGVIRAITRAEDFLASHPRMYSLGDIVHNEAELARLRERGLVTVNSLSEVPEGETVLIRAHGEPPGTYEEAKRRRLEVVDCSCPVVLQLQKRIRESYALLHDGNVHGQVIIFGRVGHAEVLGLLGQVDGDALVVENEAMLLRAMDKLDFDQPMEIFSQTTKSPSEYADICRLLKKRGARLIVHDSICAQVANRHERLLTFAREHDVILFVSGRASSNGKVLSDLCSSVNARTHVIGSTDEIHPAWFKDRDRVGICGATSTPKWLLEEVASAVRDLC